MTFYLHIVALITLIAESSSVLHWLCNVTSAILPASLTINTLSDIADCLPVAIARFIRDRC